MITGYILIVTKPGKEEEVTKILAKYSEIKSLKGLSGEWDLLAEVEAEDFNVLGRIVADEIRTLPGVHDTKTLQGTKVYK